MNHRSMRIPSLLTVLILGFTAATQPAVGVPGTPAPVPAQIQPADSDSNVEPAPVTPDVSYDTASGSRVEMFTSVGNLDSDIDWRQTNEFAYLISSVPKYSPIRATIYNAYWDGRHATADPATGMWGIYDSANTPETNIFGVTQAFRDQLNQYSSGVEAKQYIQTIGNRFTVQDALTNGSSLADLLNKAGVLQLCPYGNGSCISRVTGALFHSKYALFGKTKDSTGKLWDNVIWITSANLNGASGGKKSNTGIAIFGDAVGYNNLIENVWNPSAGMNATTGFKNAASKGLAAGSNEFSFIPSPRTVDFEGNFLATQVNSVLGGKKTSCKVYVVHSLFSMGRKAVANALVALQKDGCKVKVVVGPPSVAEITDTYFSMGEQLRKLIANFQYANVHDKTVSVSYTLSGKKTSTLFVGSANLNGTSLSGDELSVKISNATATSTSEQHSDYIYTLAKLGTNIIPVVSVQMSQSDLALMADSTAHLKADILPTNASQKGLVWRSSDPSVATVDSNGTVSGVKVGTATITAKSVQGGKTGSVVVTVTPAAAKYNDFDADEKVDLVYLHPGTTDTRGSIEVKYGDGHSDSIRPTTLGFSESSTNRYTQAVVKDIDSDGYADLIVGAPALNKATDTGTGRVYLIYGSAHGLRSDTVAMISSPSDVAAGSDGTRLGSFGTAIGAMNTPLPTLVIGEPSARTASASGGLVHVVALDSTGHPVGVQTISQDSAGVPGADEDGDYFGSAIAASGSIAVVGIPGEDIGTKADAGSLMVFRLASPTSFKASGYTQDSAGVPGVAEAGDRFGAVLAKDSTMVVVGIPNEDVGSDVDAGSIQPFDVTSTSIK